jgi:hypothetical protein
MKSWRTGAIFNPWASIRFMMGFLKMRAMRVGLFFWAKQQTAPLEAAERAF